MFVYKLNDIILSVRITFAGFARDDYFVGGVIPCNSIFGENYFFM